jgi:hypothetical protein
MQVSPLAISRGLPMQSRTLSKFGRLICNKKEWSCFRAVKENARGTERFELTISSEGQLAGSRQASSLISLRGSVVSYIV